MSNSYQLGRKGEAEAISKFSAEYFDDTLVRNKEVTSFFS